ncbi:MAG: exodeoxyribonuclease VII small subunit [Clostridia bacterium]|jgi:exodeoxyribonuclease VII small subunit|nr:exodeoxyribonuclease VII small subunit [Clostridia bacterium]
MKNIDEMSLEEAIKNLENTVSKLENSDLSLEKSIAYFEQGVKLAAHSRKILDEYTQKITVLKKENGLLKEVEIADEE